MDIITAGFPCTDLSVAGKREGLKGKRSGLFFEILRIVEEMREETNGSYPGLVVLENVPGLLSSNGGRDFAVVLSGLAESGALDIGWRILDSQWFGVAQRRRRVFIVADFRGERAGEILALSQGLYGHPAPSREAGEGTTPILEVGARTSGDGYRDGDGIGSPDDPMYSLQARHQHGVVPFDTTKVTSDKNYSNPKPGDPCHPLAAGAHAPAIANAVPNKYRGDPHEGTDTIVGSIPRRLTPVECERLQGFPDGWTDVDGMKDGPRYRMLGNAVTVNVLEWIGHRIMEAEGKVLPS